MACAPRVVASVPIGPAASRPPVTRAPRGRDAAHGPDLLPPGTDDVAPLRRTDPKRIGEYKLNGVLGSGGEAIVYRGYAPRLGPVAVKVLRDGPTASPANSCAHEFDMARRVDPRCVMAPIAVGRCHASPYLVTMYHRAYRPIAYHAPLPPSRLWRVAYTLAATLATVHASGVIHCDVKPANILAWQDDIRLIDFGIARDLDHQPTADELVRCSRGWSAPEQLSAGSLTPAVDVFGWGCVMGYLAAGVAPFASETLEGWVLRVRSAAADLSGLPDELDGLVRLALRRDPERRPSAACIAATCGRHLSAAPALAA